MTGSHDSDSASSGAGPGSTGAGLDLERLGIGPPKMEELVDRDELREMAESFERLFGVPLRIISASGSLLAASSSKVPIYEYLSELTQGRQAYHQLVSDLRKRAVSAGEPVDYSCFTGATYRIAPVEYDQTVIGRIVLGPFLEAPVSDLPESLRAADPKLDADRAKAELSKSPVVAPARTAEMCTHLISTLDLILFSGHKALMTSQMHLASVQESYRSVTQKKEELEEAYEKLKELDRLKSNFLATISHELRTPLTSIIGYSEMLAEGMGGQLTEDQLDFVQTIRTKGDQLLGLIMSLLDLSKLESGTMLMRRGDVSIRSVLSEASSTVTPTAAKKGVTVDIEVDDEMPAFRADPDRLRQVFINLAENAIKFTPKGGVVSLKAKAVEDSDSEDDEAAFVLVAPLRRQVEIRVSDTGIGIADHERDRVFQPFYQVDQSSTREQGGTGLGLSIVKRIVEAHQGTVHVENNEPHGAVFVVRIPIGIGSVPPPQRRSSPPRSPFSSSPPASRRSRPPRARAEDASSEAPSSRGPESERAGS